ncbi:MULTISPECIES: multidrug efflux SMR transporter [Polynucleobacter]|uniref:QacE family quaternary ammonium compound efflux SMR transporter n=1 Tax=Polynucleobacter tropicus TaxID=1743174 RepID=A0A6M9Q0A3_9BURK|nr:MULTISPECIES: multidrug efflux SMR transporter [Polynucleobacter]QKM64395.1 QacE family quaternary ammonium compound efflux SMR transporter [Polynucleobacter tropicus]QWD64725.1 multidrug efflux SMR transporter [Polynucleobacter sp. MWH-UH2A]
MAWFMLSLAIITEVIATTALKYTEGFTKLSPTLITLTGYGISFFALSKVLDQIPTAIAYAIWSGTGISLVGLIGWVWLDQKLDLGALIGIALIISGVVIINVFSKSISH